MEYGCVFTLTTPGLDITFNSGTDRYELDPTQCSGLDVSPDLRVPVFDAPQDHGGIVFPGKKKARHIVLAGTLLPASNDNDDRNVMAENLGLALEEILEADGTLSWTPTGLSARSLTVRYEIPLRTNGAWVKTFQFGLVAANPSW